MGAGSQEQLLEQIKLLLPALGGLFAAMGWGTASGNATLVTQILAVIGPLMLVGGSIWGILDKRESSLVKKVDALAKDPNSAVQAVITTPDKKGEALANSLPGKETVSAGTVAATEAAKS